MTDNIEAAELRAQVAELEQIISAQAEAIEAGRRLLAGCEAHNEMLLGRLKLAEAAQTAQAPVAVAQVCEDGYEYPHAAKVQWLLNPMPPSSLLYEQPPTGAQQGDQS